MLALTENVTEIVKKLTEEVPEISALRIATEPDGESISVSPADQAAPADQVLEQDGATIYLEETASSFCWKSLGRPEKTSGWLRGFVRTRRSVIIALVMVVVLAGTSRRASAYAG